MTGEIGFDATHRVVAIVKNRGRENGVRSRRKGRRNVLARPHAA
jgi:hypothetical protein